MKEQNAYILILELIYYGKLEQYMQYKLNTLYKTCIEFALESNF